MIEILRVLYDDVLRIDPSNPLQPDRDRFILSKGHGCLALYALLADKGFFPSEELATFCRPGSRLGGHPERGKLPGIEASTGSLGHGPSIGVGLSMALRRLQRSARVYVLCGDGELGEGSVWEACLHAAKHQLETFTLIVDHNGLQSYGPVSDVCELGSLSDKLTAFGFETRVVDGHDVDALRAAFVELKTSRGRPGALVAKTIKGCGVREAEHNPEFHHLNRVSPHAVEGMLQQLRDNP
jgi:transketolase